jgi:hypothetical protein
VKNRGLVIMSYVLFLFSCSQDVSISKIYEREDTSKGQMQDSYSELHETGEDTNVVENQSYNGYGGAIQYSLRQVACPYCVGEAQELTVNFSADFYEPISDSAFSWIEENGCYSNFYETAVSATPISYGNSMNINWPSGSSQLNNFGSGHYESQNIPEAYYLRDSMHDVLFPDIGESYIGAFKSIHGFDSIEPYTMLWVDPSYAFEPNFNSYSDNIISWSPSGSDVTFQVLITFYDYNSLQPIGITSCFGPDIGYINMPGAYFQYPPYSYLVISIIKHKVSSFEFDNNYSNIETYMKWEVVGTGMLR